MTMNTWTMMSQRRVGAKEHPQNARLSRLLLGSHLPSVQGWIGRYVAHLSVRSEHLFVTSERMWTLPQQDRGLRPEFVDWPDMQHLHVPEA